MKTEIIVISSQNSSFVKGVNQALSDKWKLHGETHLIDGYLVQVLKRDRENSLAETLYSKDFK